MLCYMDLSARNLFKEINNLRKQEGTLQLIQRAVNENPHFVIVCLTLLIVAGEFVGQPVALRRGSQHEGEAHEERSILGQRTVSLCHITRLTGEICAAAGGVTHTDPLSWRQKFTFEFK